MRQAIETSLSDQQFEYITNEKELGMTCGVHSTNEKDRRQVVAWWWTGICEVNHTYLASCFESSFLSINVSGIHYVLYAD